MFTCLTLLLQNLHYGLGVYIEEWALFLFPGISSLILGLMSEHGYGEYGFRMREHLRYS